MPERNWISAFGQPIGRKRFSVLSIVVAAVLALAVPSCATNPVTGKNELSIISTEREIKLIN